MLAIDDNPTRHKIVMLLNRVENMTVAELSKKMGITPMAVRQHLMSLEKKGIIKYVAKKYGIGRPVFLYSLTDGYGDFTREVLRIIEKVDGRKKLDKIFKMRKDNILAEKNRVLAPVKSMNKKISLLSDMLNKEGYMVEIDGNRDGYHLKQYNCPLSSLSEHYPEACKYELELYRSLFGAKVKRIECQREGAPSCTYIIPKG
jgi:predicted ArsR family transcriptional regulator